MNTPVAPARSISRRDRLQVRGARCHNLKAIEIDVPLHQFVVVTGVSGSGKSSLAVHTIGATGQRHFLETLSPRLRRHWDRLDPPDVDYVGHVPPVVLIQGDAPSVHSDPRSTVATLLGVETELADEFSAHGVASCPTCDLPVTAATPTTVFHALLQSLPHRKAMIAFPANPAESSPGDWVQAGYARAIIKEDVVTLSELKRWPARSDVLVVVDRLTIDAAAEQRWQESLAMAFREGAGRIDVLWEAAPSEKPQPGMRIRRLEPRTFHSREFASALLCTQCGRERRPLSPELFDRHVQESACPSCARMPAGTDCTECGGLQLSADARAVRLQGHTWSHWQTTAVRTLAEMAASDGEGEAPAESRAFANAGTISDSAEASPFRKVISSVIAQRLQALDAIGLGHLTLGRATASLSHGDVCRILVAQASVLPTTDTLFVIEEPGAGCHPADVPRLVEGLRSFLTRRNSVLVVDHHPEVIHAADHVVELGPAAGAQGGQIVAEDIPAVLESAEGTVTKQAWAKITAPFTPRPCRSPNGWSSLQGIRLGDHTLPEIRWPLGTLGVVTGRAGCGKTSLLNGLYRAWSVAISKPDPSTRPPNWTTCELPPGWNDVVLVDQTPLNRNKRSTVVTWLKIYDELREVFANTAEAKRRGWTAAQFSFLSPQGGRCPICQGLGRRFVETGLQHQETVTCPECRGMRFRPEFLEARYRGLSIHDVLMRTATEATTLFRHLPKVFSRLHALSELGLGYLVLGQPVQSLSGGEVQRLKLASRLWGRVTGPALLLCDTPSMGLHTLDIAALVRGLQQLVDLGHTVIIADHHRGLLEAADWIGELDAAGPTMMMSAGTPTEIVRQHSAAASTILQC